MRSLRNLFSADEGGFMDVIRCDETDYLVKKWSPTGIENSTRKENEIRYGSRVRVKSGEAAVFFYRKENDTIFDVIEGPADHGIETANFPILSNIVGAAFGGRSPFQAEIYFFNLEKNNQIKFGIPYFDVFDNRFPDLGVPCAVRGTFTFNLTDINNYMKLYRLVSMEGGELEDKFKDLFTRKIKSVIINIPSETNIPVMQLERKIDEINEYVLQKLKPEIEEDFGINFKRLDIAAIELDKTSPHFQQLKNATVDQQTKFIGAKTDIEITNLDEMARIQRKDTEMGVEGKNFAVHQLNLQADVLRTASENLGQMGNVNLGDGGGLNPVGLMTGMAIGGVMGNQMSGMMGGINSTPPPPPATTYHIALDGVQSGPYTIAQLKEFAMTGQFTINHHVWQQGMAGWEKADAHPGLNEIFAAVPPPPPPPTL